MASKSNVSPQGRALPPLAVRRRRRLSAARPCRRSREWPGSGGARFGSNHAMKDPVPDEVVQGDLSEAEKRANVIRLAFGGRADRFDEFCRAIRDVVPDGTTVV